MQALFERVRAQIRPSTREPCSSVTSLGPYAKIYSRSNRKSAHKQCSLFGDDINDVETTRGNVFYTYTTINLPIDHYKSTCLIF